MAVDPTRAALAFGDAVFLGELVGRLLEGFLGLEESGAVLAAQRHIPVFSELLGD